jgi:hypothetical protein
VFYPKWKPQKTLINHNLQMSELVATQASLLFGLGQSLFRMNVVRTWCIVAAVSPAGRSP